MTDLAFTSVRDSWLLSELELAVSNIELIVVAAYTLVRPTILWPSSISYRH